MNDVQGIDFSAIAANEDRAQAFRESCYKDLCRSDWKPLLSDARGNAKLRKSETEVWRVVGLSLAHAKTSGFNTCPAAVPDCVAHCVGSTSVGLSQAFPTIDQGRIRKTRFLFEHRVSFLCQLVGELHRETLSAARASMRLAARLDVFSDLPWHTPSFGCIYQLFPEVSFYGYSKILNKVLGKDRPPNCSIVFSWSGRNIDACFDVLTAGRNVAIPFGEPGPYAGNRALGQGLPERFRILGTWFDCFDGDLTDLRNLDPGPDERGFGRICALRFKQGTNEGRAAGLQTAFVVTDW